MTGRNKCDYKTGGLPAGLILLLILLVLLPMHAGCTRSTDNPDNDAVPGKPPNESSHFTDGSVQYDSELEIQDMLGRSVTIGHQPERIIGLRAGALRMITWLDATNLVAGIEEPERQADRPYLFARPELRELRVIGPLMGGDSELLVSARPDVLFMTFTTAGQADEMQARTGVPVVALDYGDFADNRDRLFDSLRLMGLVLGREARADSLISYIHDSIDELRERTADIPDARRPTAYVGGISYRGAQGINATDPHYPSFRFIRAENAAAEISDQLINPIEGTFIDKEQLLLWDPDVLFVDLSSRHLVRPEIRPGTPLHSGLSALQDGEVYGILPYNNYAANYEHVLINAWYAGTVLYPGRFNDIDIEEKADEIYEQFLGRPVYEDMSFRFGGLRRFTGGS